MPAPKHSLSWERGSAGTLQMLEQLPQSDVETEADFAVSVHGGNLTGCDRGQTQRNPAGVGELVEIQLFAFHVLLALAATERSGGDTQPDKPVRIESPIGDGMLGLSTDGAYCLFRQADARLVGGQTE